MTSLLLFAIDVETRDLHWKHNPLSLVFTYWATLWFGVKLSSHILKEENLVNIQRDLFFFLTTLKIKNAW